jgi:hypothetical protein
VSSIKRDSTKYLIRIRENFLYVFKGARSAPDQVGHRSWQAPRTGSADRDAAHLAAVTRQAFWERRALGRRLPLLALPGTAASAHELSSRPATPAQRRNDQHQARELQGRAILPALQ